MEISCRITHEALHVITKTKGHMGLAIKQQPKIYLKESVSGSHHMGP